MGVHRKQPSARTSPLGAFNSTPSAELLNLSDRQKGQAARVSSENTVFSSGGLKAAPTSSWYQILSAAKGQSARVNLAGFGQSTGLVCCGDCGGLSQRHPKTSQGAISRPAQPQARSKMG